MRNAALAGVLALSLTACASLTGGEVGGILIQGSETERSWATELLNTTMPLCDGDDVPDAVYFQVRELRATGLVTDYLERDHGFTYQAQIDRINEAVQKAIASGQAGASRKTVERRYNLAQLRAVDLFVTIARQEHSSFFDIPDPFDALEAMAAKKVAIADVIIDLSADISEACDVAGYPIQEPTAATVLAAAPQ